MFNMKFVILQCDRYIEFHSQEGRYYRLRIPKFGHDMKYHFSTCDLYIGGNRYLNIISSFNYTIRHAHCTFFNA